MILLQSGFFRAMCIDDSDLVIFNTCSVRQKGEDRVFGFLNEIDKFNELRKSSGVRGQIISGITGCMVRKTGLAKRYLETHESEEKIEKHSTKRIQLLKNKDGIHNYDDDLFRRTLLLDFTLRIEETKYLPLILSEIFGEKIGQEDKYDDYLKQVQQRENPFSASVIIQSGCDNYCTFCIVPFTRGAEVSREKEEILLETKNAVESGAKEITLLGQNVNSYGKQKNTKLWNTEKSKWNTEDNKLKIGVDLDDTLFVVLGEELLKQYNQKFHDIVKMDDIDTFDCGGIVELMNEYHIFESDNAHNLEIHSGGEKVLKGLKSEGHKIYVITSREIEAKDDTHTILNKYFGDDFFEDIIFIKDAGHDNKYTAANQHSLDIVIDDGPHHIQSYDTHFNGKICVFHAPWNRGIKENNSNIFRIIDWYDFENLLPKLSFTSPFRELLEELDDIKGLDRIRFTSSNPHDMTRDILDAHFDCHSTCNYLHFALQSGSDAMLKRMNRRHSYTDFKDMVDYMRSKDPLFSISTDIIVGFSGETEEMFQDTLRAMKECEFDYCYIARYSVRPNTLAAKMLPDDVPEAEKARRWHILNDALLESVKSRNARMIGRTEEILVSGSRDGVFFGRTRNFKEVFFKAPLDTKVGSILNVKITELDKYVLKGEFEKIILL
ncbi:radical SAM protein [Candidatus Gracilibacteria bacterium]|nr:radical SAM protein [Candidatus Gracilibacteria bacterium]